MRIFFDIDDTLFPTTEFAELARRNATRAMIEMGLEYGREELYQKLVGIIQKRGSNYEEHFNELCKELKIKRNSRYVAAAIAAYHNTKSTISPYPEVPKLLLELKEQGHKIYIATNGNAIKQWDKLVRLGISIFFDDVFVSEEMKVGKSKRFFELVMKELGAKKEECIMIGDREDADIIPAKEAGIKSIKIIRKEGKYCREAEKTSADFKISNLKETIKCLKSVGLDI
ncbi:MAG: TIGR02253 family HAD-type hydrolase [Candidatus Micrarchaeota archaeon]